MTVDIVALLPFVIQIDTLPSALRHGRSSKPSRLKSTGRAVGSPRSPIPAPPPEIVMALGVGSRSMPPFPVPPSSCTWKVKPVSRVPPPVGGT